MQENKQNRLGLHLLAAMIIVLFCAAAYEHLSHGGMSTTAVWLVVISGALLLGGIYFLLSGVIFESAFWLMRRFGKLKSEESAPKAPESAKPVVPEVIPVAVSPESEQDRQVLENAIKTVCQYTDLVFGDAINDDDKKLLHGYLTEFANRRSLPMATRQIRVDREKINYIDLCHYGWNIWAALKGARNRFCDQKELVVWLKKCFVLLNRYDERTLRAKLRATDGVSYTIRNEESLKEYLEKHKTNR